LQLKINGNQVILKQKDKQYIFTSTKEFDKKEIIIPI